MGSFGKFFTLYWPPKTWLHRSESELLKMHALLNWAIALSDVRTLFFDNSLIRSSLRKSKITHRFWAFAQYIRAMCPALHDKSRDQRRKGEINCNRVCAINRQNYDPCQFGTLPLNSSPVHIRTQKSPAGTQQREEKNLDWFWEIERKLAKLSMTTFANCSSY
jgi:hypothetical protein